MSLRNDEQKASTQSVSLSSAGFRALIYQASAIYLRTPIKLFRPSRFDYMVYVREQANRHFGLPSKPYKFHTHSSLAMLINVTKREGWRFIPDHLLPPLLANSATGFILYGTYLTSLNWFDSRRGRVDENKRRAVGDATENASDIEELQGQRQPKQGLAHETNAQPESGYETNVQPDSGYETNVQPDSGETSPIPGNDKAQQSSANQKSQISGNVMQELTLSEQKPQRREAQQSKPEQAVEPKKKEALIKGYSYTDTWKAGFIAGAVQSLAAAPIDAIYSRSSTAELLSGKHENFWKYGAHKLKEIGLVGVFAGYFFSLVKETFGFAFYFSTFEVVKTKGYNFTYSVISAYRNLRSAIRDKLSRFSGDETPKVNPEMIRLEQARSTRILRSTFILLAGASAALALLSVQYPLQKLQKTHFHRLEALDFYNSSKSPAQKRPFIKLYYNSYLDTLQYVQNLRRKSKLSWTQLAYKGFGRNALTTIPATSVGLLVFEIMRSGVSEHVENLNASKLES